MIQVHDEDECYVKNLKLFKKKDSKEKKQKALNVIDQKDKNKQPEKRNHSTSSEKQG